MANEPVTVLITDMEGSTAFTADRGDRVAVELVRTHERLVREVLGLHRGREIKSMGDGFMLMFSTPADGVLCALDLQGSLAEHNAAHPDQPLNVRMGINTGPVIEEKGDIYGTTVNAAARIAAKARSGQVLVSDEVRDVATNEVDCRFVDRGLFWLKGLQQQWRLYEATRGAVTPYRPAIAEGRTPFVDRDVERARLRRYVDAALDGHGGFVLLAGDAGAGKSRLADEMGGEAQGRGMHHVLGRCYEVTQNQAYTPLVETLEALERRLAPSLFRRALGEAAGEIARLVPQIRRRFPDIPPAAELPPEQERRYLYSSTRDVLAAMAAVRPLFIAWDDLHWADEPTLAFLEHIAADLFELPILVVATCTHTELTPARPLRVTIEKLHRRRLIEQVEVGTLRQDDIRTLLTSIGGIAPPDRLVEVLHRDTEGNVFFFEEVVRHLAERGLLFDDEGAWRSPASEGVSGIELEVPETLRLTIGRRLEILAEPTRKMLTRAAIIGRGFGWELLETIADVDEEALLDAMDEAERARLITSTTEAGFVRFTFSHELIRQTLADDVSPARRQRLHLQIADAIETVHANDVASHADAIAAHLERAGDRDPDRSVRFLVLAGERALAVAAYEEAQRHLSRALDLLPQNDPLRRGQVLEKLGAAERSLGHPDEAIKTWHRALDAYQAAGDADAGSRLCLDAGLQVAWWIRGGRPNELVDRGLGLLGDRVTPVRAGLIALSGALASQAGSYEEGAALFDQAVPMARQQGDARILGLVLYAKAAHHFAFNEHRQTMETGRESMSYLRDAGELWNLSNVLGYLGASGIWLGDFDESNRYGSEGLGLARRLGNWPAVIFCERATLYPGFGEQPDLAWYEADGQRALDLGDGQGFRWLSALGRTRMGLAAFWSGRWDDALFHFEEAKRLEPPGASGGHAGGLILINAYLGRHDEAKALLDERRSDFAVPDQAHSLRNESLALVGIEAFAVMDEFDEAAALYPIARQRLSEGIIARGWDYRLLWTLTGIGATCAGDWDDAEAHFREGLRRVETLPLRLEEGDCRRFYAWMLLRRRRPGDAALARAQLDRAIASYQRIGMPVHARLAQDMLQSA